MTTSTVKCPDCGGTNIRSIESLQGSCDFDTVTDGIPDFNGYTEVYWDSSETTGYECGHCLGSDPDLNTFLNNEEPHPEEVE